MIQESESESEWWGFSQHDGWMVLDWNDPRNRPGVESPRRLYLIRCRDWSEVSIRCSDWISPTYLSAQDWIAAHPDLNQTELLERVRALQEFFYPVHSRLEAVRPLHADYISFAKGKWFFDLCDSLGISSLYHITHIENLPGILRDGLLCHRRANPLRDISNADIQYHRSDKLVPGLEGLTLHDFVPLFLAPRPPMLSALREMQEEIIYLLISPDVLLQPQVVFTNGNARSNNTQFHQQIRELVGLDWNLLRARYWNHDDPTQHRENKRRRSAEVLVPGRLAPVRIDKIWVMTDACCQKVLDVLSNLKFRIPVVVQPEVYYPSRLQSPELLRVGREQSDTTR